MFSRRTAAIVVLCCAAGAAAIPAVRIRCLLPVGAGATENPCADGMAKIKYFQDPSLGPAIKVHVHLHHFMPNTTYGVYVNSIADELWNVAAVTTNAAGNGNWHITLASNGVPDPSETVVFVFRDLNPPNGVYDGREVFTDLNNNNMYDPGEPFVDLVGDEQPNFGESFTDLNCNDQYDVGEPFDDANGNLAYDIGEERAMGMPGCDDDD